MYCRNCGKQIKDGAAFCPYCGAKTAVKKAEPTISLKEVPEKKKSSKIIPLVVVVIVLLILVTGRIFVKNRFFQSDDQKQTVENEMIQEQADDSSEKEELEEAEPVKAESEEEQSEEEKSPEEETLDSEESAAEESEQTTGEIIQDSNADTQNSVTMETLEDGIYEYTEGEYISDLEIYEENGVKKAYLGLWHNYGDSASDEDFYFVWEDGKWKYQIIGNRSAEAFDLDITPEDSEHIHIKLTQSEWNGSYSWPSGNTTPVWLDTEFVKASE